MLLIRYLQRKKGEIMDNNKFTIISDEELVKTSGGSTSKFWEGVGSAAGKGAGAIREGFYYVEVWTALKIDLNLGR